MLYVTRMTKKKNDSIGSILHYGRVVDNDSWVVFPASGFPYLILRPVFQTVQKKSSSYLYLLSYKN